MTHSTQPQGKFLGIPYDWRFPTVSRLKARIYRPGGSLFSPKVFGWGYTLNLAHPAAKWLLVTMAILGASAMLAALFRG